MATNDTAKHAWRFFRAGGSDQVALTTGDDIAHLAELDQKLWTALSFPTEGIRADIKTLELLDTDHDKRVRAPEVLAAVDWLNKRLTTLDGLVEGKDTVPLAAINTETEEGKGLLEAARRVLSDMGKGDAGSISLADIQDTERIFSSTPFNGDGILPPESVSDPEIQKTLQEVADTIGTETDRSGKPGVSQAQVDAFFAAAADRLAWRKQLADDAKILPLGPETEAAAAALTAVRTKIDDYFTRCALAAFDGRSVAPLSRSDADYVALADGALTDGTAALAEFPLSKIDAEATLSLEKGINPYWQAAIDTARAKLFTPMGVGGVLTRSEWNKIKAAFDPYFAWTAGEAGKAVAAIDDERLAALLGGKQADAIKKLIEKDAALAPAYARLAEIEQLLLYHTHLYELLNNMVNMSQLYKPTAWPIFRVGTLYLDGRACTLCFHVADVGAHSAGVTEGNCCLVYCEISKPGSGEKRTVCAPVTAGVAKTLSIGRNGVFYDVDGQDWEAKIVKLLDHAISLKEAFWMPWRKIVSTLSGQITKMLASKQEAATANVAAQASAKLESATTAPAAAAPAPKKVEGAALASSVAAVGIAVGLIGQAVGGLVKTASELPVWKSLLGVVAVILVVSLPSVILTWFKLRARDLAPILNACGWAVNRRLGFSLKLGRLFTLESALPPGSKRCLTDPYADRKPWWTWFLLILVILGAAAGVYFKFFCPRCKGTAAPAEKPAVEAPAAPAEKPPAEAPAATKPADAPATPAS
ncbi:MAG: hypothetical protein J6334_06625 [Kiritimatiellae bacterium]|nr:hypothetical protein [Kiritimatiellia bacterium]